MYDVYIDSMLLPIAPSELEIKINNQNRTLSLIGDGEINVLKKMGLKDINFTCLIPQSEYPFAVYPDGFKPAKFFLDAFENLKESQVPFQFIISRVKPDGELLYDNDIKVSMEDYKIADNVNNGFDLTVEINLKEYRNFSTKKTLEFIENPIETAPKAIIHEDRPDENPPQAKTYTVVEGDSLWEISRKYLGEGSRWEEILSLNPEIEENNLVTGRARHTIRPNQTFILPDC